MTEFVDRAGVDSPMYQGGRRGSGGAVVSRLMFADAMIGGDVGDAAIVNPSRLPSRLRRRALVGVSRVAAASRSSVLSRASQPDGAGARLVLDPVACRALRCLQDIALDDFFLWGGRGAVA